MRSKFPRFTAFFVATAAISAILFGCSCDNAPKPNGSDGGAGLSGKIVIDGSSTVFKLSQAVAQEFRKVHHVSMKVNKKGTGGGFKDFVKGNLEICGASRPIQESELKQCAENGVEFIELPICFDAITIVVNKENDWATSITTEELKKLWETAATEKILKWNQIRPEWPNQQISLYGAGTDSGTFEYFTEAVCGKKGDSRTDYTASEDDNSLIVGIEGDKHALGYIPFAYFVQRTDKLKALEIDWTAKKTGPIAPSRESVEAGKYNPLSRPLFIYVNKKDALRPEVKAFVEYYLTNGRKLSEAIKYIPLREEAYTLGLERFAKLQTGSAFGGHSEFGLAVEDILKREIK